MGWFDGSSCWQAGLEVRLASAELRVEEETYSQSSGFAEYEARWCAGSHWGIGKQESQKSQNQIGA